MQKLYCYGDSFTWGCSLNHSPIEFSKQIHPNEYNFNLRYSRKLSHLLNVKEKNKGLNGFAMDDIISMLYNDFILGKHNIINQVRKWILSNNPKIYHKIYSQITIP